MCGWKDHNGQFHLKEASDYVDIGAGSSHEHTDGQAGVHVLQVHLGGMRSATKMTVSRSDGVL